jgi:hypothetical protein
MQPAWFLPLLVLGACEATTPQGAFEPRAVATAVAPTADETDGADEAETPDEDDPFADEVDPDEQGDVEELSPEELYRALGAGSEGDFDAALAEGGEPMITSPAAVAAPVEAVAAPVAAVQRWQAGQPMAGSWGVRLVSTVNGALPPRAILGLPDGSEKVVQPGDLLPSVGVVVLAIGQDVVQVAQVTPVGDHARVESTLLPAMYTGRGPGGSP